MSVRRFIAATELLPQEEEMSMELKDKLLNLVSDSDNVMMEEDKKAENKLTNFPRK